MTLRCMCEAIVEPKKTWFRRPRTADCPSCGFKFALPAEMTETAEACRQRAESCFRNDDTALSLSYASAGLAIDPHSIECRYLRAMALLKGKHTILQLPNDFTVCIDNNYCLTQCILNRAIAYRMLGQVDRALAGLTSLLEEHRHLASRSGTDLLGVLKTRGEVFCEAGRFAESLSDFDEYERSPYAVSGDRLTLWRLRAEYQGDEKRAFDELMRRKGH